MSTQAKQKLDKESLDPSTWVSEYGDYLFRYAVVMVKNHSTAEELVQETFLAAIKGLDKFEGRSTVKTWLRSILKNKTIDHFRKSSRRKEMPYEERKDRFQ